MITRAWAVPALLLAVAAAADEARIQVPVDVAAAVVTGEHDGFSVTLERHGDEIFAVVTQRIDAIGVEAGPSDGWRAGCPDPEALQAPPLDAVPARLRRAATVARTSYELVGEVVAWVSERIVQDERDRGPQDAMSVLVRGRGRCSGRANLAVGLLRVLGVPARVVHGVLAAEDAVRPHRWGEAWLGAAGWVAFDPGATVGLVRVRYLRTGATLDEARLSECRLVSVGESGFAALPRWRGLRVRPERGASLHCVVRGGRRLVARLEGPDGVVRERTGAVAVVFPDLVPGGYALRWARDGAEGGPVNLTISGERDVRLSLDALEVTGR